MTPRISSDEFMKRCKLEIVKYFNEHCDTTDNKRLNESDVYVVWYCKTLQNHKALLSTNVSDGMYYEFTYNGDTMELYMDAYKKWENVAIKW